MISNHFKSSTMASLLATLLILSGCASATDTKVDKTTTTAFKSGVPGGTLVQTYETTAFVKAIDPITRQVTLVAPDNSQSTFTAGPSTRLDEIKAGTLVKVSVARELVMFMNQNDLPDAPSTAAIAGSTPGASPEVLTSGTKNFTANVTAIDLTNHTATLKLSDGRTGTFKIRPDVDLTKVELGDKVFIRTSTSAAILQGKP